MNCLRSLTWLCSMGLPLVVGCGDQVLSDYGIAGGPAGTSLNGTRVLSDMFAAAGHRVKSRSYLSPSLDRVDVVVWFPDDFDAPTWEVEQWLSSWLVEGDPDLPPRVLIYVGRDYDAAPDYWQRMQGQAPAGLKQEYARRLAEAKADEAANKPGTLSRSEAEGWFTLDDKPPQKKVKQLRGDWATGIDASKTDIRRSTHLVPDDDERQVLLADGQREPLVTEFDFSGYYDSETAGRLIMIENGSWLLSARLVNKEHRKLAGKLVSSIGPPRRQVVFLESGTGGPPIHDTDPSLTPPTGLALFRVWPIGVALSQLAALGIVFAMMRWPIFGLPKRLMRHSPTDFASHIAALGSLLQKGRNRAQAIGLLLLYRKTVHAVSRGQEPLSPTEQLAQHTPPLPPSPEATE